MVDTLLFFAQCAIWTSSAIFIDKAPDLINSDHTLENIEEDKSISRENESYSLVICKMLHIGNCCTTQSVQSKKHLHNIQVPWQTPLDQPKTNISINSHYID